VDSNAHIAATIGLSISSHCSELVAVTTGDKTSEVFVTSPPSPSAAAASIGPSIATSTGSPTLIPRLSDVFAAQVPDIPALAGLSVTLGVDFIQINCGKRISAMALL
jgi:hypothetical protein